MRSAFLLSGLMLFGVNLPAAAQQYETHVYRKCQALDDTRGVVCRIREKPDEEGKKFLALFISFETADKAELHADLVQGVTLDFCFMAQHLGQGDEARVVNVFGDTWKRTERRCGDLFL